MFILKCICDLPFQDLEHVLLRTENFMGHQHHAEAVLQEQQVLFVGLKINITFYFIVIRFFIL